jgi:hypothetical protein
MEVLLSKTRGILRRFFLMRRLARKSPVIGILDVAIVLGAPAKGRQVSPI